MTKGNDFVQKVTMRQIGDDSFLPARPCEEHLSDLISVQGGLTKREYFAAMAMQGILSSFESNDFDCNTINNAAYFAVMSSDALIKALNVPSKP